MKYPWMPIFWGDFLANTMHLSAQEAGAYLFLIAHCWENEGKIPTARVRLARIAHVRHDQWPRVWSALQHFFKVESGVTPIGVTLEQCYTHQRVMDELHRLGKISNKRKEAAEQKHSKRPANGGAKPVQNTLYPTSTSNKESSNGEGSKHPTEGTRTDWRDPGTEYRSPPPKKSDNVLTEADKEVLAALQRKGGVA